MSAYTDAIIKQLVFSETFFDFLLLLSFGLAIWTVVALVVHIMIIIMQGKKHVLFFEDTDKVVPTRT